MRKKHYRLLSILLIFICTLSACGIVQVKETSTDTREETKKSDTTSSEPEMESGGFPSEAASLEVPSVMLPFSGMKAELDPTDLSNSSLNPFAGRVVHAYGGTWFVQRGLKNDGSETGEPWSEDIYFLSDEEGSEPLLITSMPASIWDGIDQPTIVQIVPGIPSEIGMKLYYFRGAYELESFDKYALFEMDLFTGNQVLIDEGISPLYGKFLNCDTACLYFLKDTGLFILDLSSGITEEAGQFDLPQGPKRALDIKDGYLYYLRLRDGDFQPYGIYRASLSDGGEEEIAPFHNQYLYNFRAFCTGRYFCYIVDDSASDLQSLVIISIDNGQEMLRFKAKEFLCGSWSIEGDYFYWLDHDPDTDSISLEKIYIPSCPEEKTINLLVHYSEATMAVFENDVWFVNRNSSAHSYPWYRMKKDSRIVPQNAVVFENLRDLFDGDSHVFISDEGLKFREYPACVDVRGYEGTESVLTIPAVIIGKPVAEVHILFEIKKDNAPFEKLILQEGIRSLFFTGTAAEELKEIYLPESLEHIMVIGLSKDVKVYYTGTREAWKALLDQCAGMEAHGSVFGRLTRRFQVQCSDGVWAP